MLTLDLVRYNAPLARALLAGKGAVACAEAALPEYPFPAPEDASWETPESKLMLQCVEMTPANMHASPSAAAVHLFPASWRIKAAALARQRLVQADDTSDAVEQLLAQYMAEHNCSKPHARMQLAAADVQTAQFPGDRSVVAYMTCDSDGCHLNVSGVDVPRPDGEGFRDMQDELDAKEQLIYLIMTNTMAHHYRRVAYSQPLELAQGSKTEECLRFCDECHTNWDMDWDGARSAVMYCPAQGCDYMVHHTCAGARGTCPLHSSRQLQSHTIQPTGAGDVVVCSGIVSLQGAMCFMLARWSTEANSRQAVGILHPVALESLVKAADEHIASGRWHALDSSAGNTSAGTMARLRAPVGGSRRVFETIAEAGSLYHLLVTGAAPACWPSPSKPCNELMYCLPGRSDLARTPPELRFPAATGLGQLPTLAPSAIRLCGTLRDALATLQVYPEPSFGRMCGRFKATGCDVDETLMRWLGSGLPLLPGEVGGGDPHDMHTQAQMAVLSVKTRERAQSGGHAARHWSVTQAEEALPASDALDRQYMSQLGLPYAAPLAITSGPPATPDVGGASSASPSTDYSVFAMRVLMNPSAYTLLVQRILADASSAHGALEILMGREITPIAAAPADTDVRAFREACMSSPLYGQVYMWLLCRGDQYAMAWEADTTGLLASADYTAGKEWHGDWAPVDDLRACTDSAYAAFGCGTMGHRRAVLMHCRNSYLFERDLGALHALATGPPLGDRVHVVPCAWDDLDLDSIGEARLVATVHRSGVSAPPLKAQAQYLTVGGTGERWAGSDWEHHCLYSTGRTRYAYDTYTAMRR